MEYSSSERTLADLIESVRRYRREPYKPLTEEDSPSFGSAAFNALYRDKLFEFLFQCGFNFHVTLQPNIERLTYAHGRQILCKYDAFVARKFLGRTWRDVHSPYRTFFIAIPEGDEKRHYHLLLRTPPQAHWLSRTEIPLCLGPQAERNLRKACLDNLVTGERSFLCPGLTIKARSAEEPDLAARYVTKDAFERDAIRHWVLSSQFHANRPKKAAR